MTWWNDISAGAFAEQESQSNFSAFFVQWIAYCLRLGVTCHKTYLSRGPLGDAGAEHLLRLIMGKTGGFEIIREGEKDTSDSLVLFDKGLFELSFGEETSFFSFATFDRTLLQEVIAIVRGNTTEEEQQGAVFVVTSGAGGLNLTRVGLGGVPLVRENYGHQVLMDYDRVSAALQAENPPARLSLFSGQPGTGKTYLLRGLLHEVRATFVMIPPNLVAELAGPALVPLLVTQSRHHRHIQDMQKAESAPMVLVIEDADTCLVTRGHDNMSEIATLLNLSDGILGAVMDLRIVATTNAQRSGNGWAMDAALLRPGRLVAHVEVEALKQDQASAVLTRLLSAEKIPVTNGFSGNATLAQVYAKALEVGLTSAKG